MMTEDDKWKRRFVLFATIRLFGLALFIGGVFVAFTDVFKPGGEPLLGSLLALTGVIDAVIAPRILKRGFEKQDREG